jgi:glucan 1,3-beta-glucosidase
MKRLLVKTVISVAAAIFLMVNSAAAAPFIGINYGPFHNTGQSPQTSTFIPDSQIISDLGIIAPHFTIIKTYGCDKDTNLYNVVPLATQHYPNLKIYQGVYESPLHNSLADTTFLDDAIALANTYANTVSAIVVGNECLPGDPNPSISVSQMITDLQYVKSKLKNGSTKVTTSLTYAAAQQYGSQLAPYCDFIMINIYPFYGQVSIENNAAITNLIQAYNTFNRQFNGKQVIIGETGWPSGGSSQGNAIPSVANEQTFTKQIFANAGQLGATFIFEAFDEPWLSAQNDIGPHWGLWNSNGTPKFTFSTSKGAGLQGKRVQVPKNPQP